MTYRTTGAERSWQFRPSDHCRDEGLRKHIHGPIVGMDRARPPVARLAALIVLPILAVTAVYWAGEALWVVLQ